MKNKEVKQCQLTDDLFVSILEDQFPVRKLNTAVLLSQNGARCWFTHILRALFWVD